MIISYVKPLSSTWKCKRHIKLVYYNNAYYLVETIKNYDEKVINTYL